MSETHSPEPWEVGPHEYPGRPAAHTRIVDAHGVEVATIFGDDYYEFDATNARRITACVNALGGIRTEAIEHGGVGVLLAAAMKARCELQAVTMHTCGDCEECSTCEALADLDAAVRYLELLDQENAVVEDTSLLAAARAAHELLVTGGTLEETNAITLRLRAAIERTGGGGVSTSTLAQPVPMWCGTCDHPLLVTRQARPGARFVLAYVFHSAVSQNRVMQCPGCGVRLNTRTITDVPPCLEADDVIAAIEEQAPLVERDLPAGPTGDTSVASVPSRSEVEVPTYAPERLCPRVVHHGFFQWRRVRVGNGVAVYAWEGV